jgi:CHAD domain-containing protein
LRYGLEWLGRKSRALKALQDELGRLTDTAVTLAELERCPQAAEFIELRAETQRSLELAFDDALTAWRDTDIDADEDNDA